MRTHPKGYIALISVLLISVSLLIAVASLSFAGYLNRFVVLDAQSKEQSLAYAEACISQAMGEIARNASYSPTNFSLEVAGLTNACVIESVFPSGTNRTITAHSIVNTATTRIQTTINASTLVVSSWNEVP